MHKRIFIGIALFIGLLSFLTAAAQATGDTTSMPLEKAVRTAKLANGFTYYIRHNEEPKNRVVMYLVTKAGSTLEADDQRGLAHFMEHMNFNGTKNFPKGELVNYLQKSGVRFGADLNAYTSFDETVYQLPIPSDNPDILKHGIQIMRDWAQEALLSPEEINKERGVVLEEKRLGKGAGERMRSQYFPILLNQSRYADRLPIGNDDVLKNFKPEAVRSYYHDWYRPDLQALIVVGDIDVGQIEQTIKAKFGDLKNPPNEKPRKQYSIPLTGKNQFIVVTDKEEVNTNFSVIIKSPSSALRSVADFRNSIIRSLYNSMMASRYNELSVKADPDFLSGRAGINKMLANLDDYEVSVIAKPGELERGVKAVWREVERVKRYGFTQGELERAKTNYLQRTENELKEKDKTQSSSLINEYVQHFLNGNAAPGIETETAMVRTALPGIGLADVDSLNSRYITTTNRDILVTAPEKDKTRLPDESTVNSWLEAVAKEPLKPYADMPASLSLLSAEPQPGKIVAEEKDDLLNTTTLTLSNGVKVVLKPTGFKNNEILFKGFSEGGTSLYSDADYQSASNAASIISSGGLGNMDAIQLYKYMTGKEAGAYPFISERSQGVSGYAQPKDLETALQLTYACFTAPRKDQDVFAGNLSRMKASFINRNNDPQAVFQDTLMAVLGNYNVRRTTLNPVKLEQINLNRAFEIYKERFADASGFVFTFVGSFNTDSIKPLLEKYLGSLPATRKNEKAIDLDIHAADGRIEKTVYKGSEPKAIVWLYFHGKFSDTQENRLNMKALREALQIRLVERLREEESGVYSPSVSFSSHKIPERYMIAININCAPENVEKMIASALDEVEKLKASGPLQVNVNKFRAEDLRSLELALKTNSFWLSYLTLEQEEHGDMHEIFTYTSNADKVTPQTVQQRAKTYLSGKNFIRLVFLPEKKAAKN